MINNAGVIKTLFPKLETLDLQGEGLNIYTDYGVITIWFKKQKYHNSRAGKWVRFNHINELTEYIKKTSDPGSRPIIQTFTDGSQVIHGKQKFVEDSGTQKCIDHLIKRADNMQKNGAPVATIVMVKIIAEELKQFL